MAKILEVCVDSLASARAAIRAKEAVRQIARMENLEATEEDIAQALAVIARQNNMTLEQLKPHYDSEFEKAVVGSILTSKVMRLIRDNAAVTVVEN